MEPGPNAKNWFDLTGKVALITGPGRGIGAAIALAFAGAGADVTVASRTKTQLDEVPEQAKARGRRALVHPFDVSELDRLGELIDATVAEFGRLDILVNNAGGSTSYPFMDTRIEHLRDGLAFNVLAPFELSRLAVPHLLEHEGSSIINIGSMGSLYGPQAGLGPRATQ